jgi:hypothetical protein
MSSCVRYKNSSRFGVATELASCFMLSRFYFCRRTLSLWAVWASALGAFNVQTFSVVVWMSSAIVHTLVRLLMDRVLV